MPAADSVLAGSSFASSAAAATITRPLIDALVIPVGLAFEEAYRRFPDLKLHNRDGTHPSLLGTYLAACTTFATLYGRSPVGNSYRAEGITDEALATQLQQVAQDVVTQFFQRN